MRREDYGYTAVEGTAGVHGYGGGYSHGRTVPGELHGQR